MKYAAAVLLSQLGGKAHPKKSDIVTILKASSEKVDEERVTALLGKVGQKSGQDLIDEGLRKMAAMSFSGGAVAAAAAPVKEEKKEEKKVEPKKEEKPKEEPKEEEEEADLGGLFDFCLFSFSHTFLIDLGSSSAIGFLQNLRRPTFHRLVSSSLSQFIDLETSLIKLRNHLLRCYTPYRLSVVTSIFRLAHSWRLGCRASCS
jgi:ribosomal protein L12E/L44/L45/RPP1/RPP2